MAILQIVPIDADKESLYIQHFYIGVDLPAYLSLILFVFLFLFLIEIPVCNHVVLIMDGY